jgi:hypothetical protein
VRTVARVSLQNGLTFPKIPQTAKPIQRLDPDQILVRAGSNPSATHCTTEKANSGSTSNLETL